MAEHASTELSTFSTGDTEGKPDMARNEDQCNDEKENPAVTSTDQPAVIGVNGNTLKQTSADAQGVDNVGFVECDETSMIDETPPPLSYVDFIPEFLEKSSQKDEAPKYAPFCTLVEKANQWLIDHQNYTVWKCETIYFKLTADDTIATEPSLFAESAFGVNKFVMCLRMWILPRLTDTIPISQIGYTTALPGWQYTVREPSEFDAFDPNIPLNPEHNSANSHKSTDHKTVTSEDKKEMQGPNSTINVSVTDQTNNPVTQNKVSVDTEQKSNGDAKTNDITETNEKSAKLSEEKGENMPCAEQTSSVLRTELTPEESENRKQSETAPRPRAVMKPAVSSTKVEVSLTTSFTECVRNMNRQISKKPFPGVILNVEMVNFRISQTTNAVTLIDPDNTSWAESGSLSRIFVSAIRVFFIHGKQEFTTIGFHDELPEMSKISMTNPKFGPFSNVVKKTGEWLKQQTNIRVVNMQSLDMKCTIDSSAVPKLNTDLSGHIEPAYTDSRYAKVLRTFYVTTKKMDTSPYQPITLTTKLFVPVRISGKTFENFPKTMKRMTKWMKYTQIPPFAVETIRYQVYLMGDGTVVRENKVDTNVSRNSGRYQLSTVRLYLPSEFIDPPPEISPDVATADGSSWGCNIS